MTWFGVSVSMVVANTWLFRDWQGVGFPFPVLTTMVHMWLKVLVTRVVYRLKVSALLLSRVRAHGGRAVDVKVHHIELSRHYSALKHSIYSSRATIGGFSSEVTGEARGTSSRVVF